MAEGSSSGVKLLLDETIGRNTARSAAALFQFAKPPVVVEHMIDFTGRAGAKDPEWLRRAAEENWFVITGDRGKSKDGLPLDLLLPLNGVSGAFMTGTLHGGRNGFEKMRAILTLWPRTERAATKHPRGTRFRMRVEGDTFSLAEWPLDERTLARMAACRTALLLHTERSQNIEQPE